jgi:hypothetical protein
MIYPVLFLLSSYDRFDLCWHGFTWNQAYERNISLFQLCHYQKVSFPRNCGNRNLRLHTSILNLHFFSARFNVWSVPELIICRGTSIARAKQIAILSFMLTSCITLSRRTLIIYARIEMERGCGRRDVNPNGFKSKRAREEPIIDRPCAYPLFLLSP